MQEFFEYANAWNECELERNTQRVKDDYKNAVLTGYYSALFSKQRRLGFPENIIRKIYEEHTEVSVEDLKKKTAILKNIKKGGISNGRRNH